MSSSDSRRARRARGRVEASTGAEEAAAISVLSSRGGPARRPRGRGADSSAEAALTGVGAAPGGGAGVEGEDARDGEGSGAGPVFAEAADAAGAADPAEAADPADPAEAADPAEEGPIQRRAVLASKPPERSRSLPAPEVWAGPLSVCSSARRPT
ncbi:hypothetical protein [Brachybacterium subflavum]|uniref:hypothetical protein n=1 Tax=Brachybacterium subflavum TaxID=2585206 RepID=UPI0012660FEF|nr:hypothetical protein [Brachybacterium subflavum]